MTNESVMLAVRSVWTRLHELSESDEGFRKDLQSVAEALLALTQKPTEDGGHASDECSPQAQVVGVPEETEALPELTFGQSVSTPATDYTEYVSSSEVSADDLPIAAACCRLKAEGIRWAVKRHSLLGQGASYSVEIEPVDREIIARAKGLPNCFLWMCHPDSPIPTSPTRFEDVASCFDMLADCLTMFHSTNENPHASQSDLEELLDLIAETQSALRTGLHRITAPNDMDQNWAYAWLRQTAMERQVFIERYMRSNDPADPSNLPHVEQRLAELATRLEEAGHKAKAIKKILGKIRYKCSQIVSSPEIYQDEWDSIMRLCEELLENGVPASNRDLRDALLPAIDYLPEEFQEFSKSFRLVLREIDTYLANQPQRDKVVAAPWSEDVSKARKLLKGKSVLMIGGEFRQPACDSLKTAFELGDMVWISTKEHESISHFEPHVGRSDIVVVLLAIRWSSHSFGEVKEFCDKYGKPLVRLPGGYNPNQVAKQIMSQASQQLGNGDSGE